MAWVEFYESDDFQDGYIKYDAEVSVPQLSKVKLSNGKSGQDQMDSLKLGPDSWLVIYKDVNYEGKKRYFNPNTIVRKLDDYDIGDTISSFRLYDAEPADWPGPSTPDHQETTILMEIEKDQLIDKFGDLVAGLAGSVPKIGSALKGLVSFLWPDKKDLKKIWNEIKDEVTDIVRELIDLQKAADMEKRLDGLGNQLDDYNNTSFDTPQKGQQFTSILMDLNDDEPYFFDQSSPQITLTYFVNLGTIELSVLREQYLYYSDIYAVPDPDQAVHLKKLQDKITEFSEGAGKAREAAMDWRLNLIHTEKFDISGVHGCWAVDDFDDWKGGRHNPDEMYLAEKDAEKRKKQVEKDYGATLDILLYPAAVWKYFDPTITDLPVLKQVVATSGPFGGTTGKSFKDSPNGEPITGIWIYTGSRVDGIEVFYGDKSGGLHGGRWGDKHTIIKLRPEESIVAAYGKDGDSMDQLFFRTSEGRDLGGGGDGGSNWSAIRPGGTDAVLGWISGIQGSRSLESITFHWVYWQKY